MNTIFTVVGHVAKGMLYAAGAIVAIPLGLGWLGAAFGEGSLAVESFGGPVEVLTDQSPSTDQAA